ncbi:MAG TPA: L-threonylcarbamoyladenylate synthase [Kiritimatiellia bacterium]|jgi:L-threonylcarbamoyladenylate synthase|nr:L-threonylcarbamoyladenylate synthase [Kiritimatiellia bacterium]HPK37187.1 L-threonylcarbamoyladenylate synthase [Kiritimatiellia bacterium]HPW74812.1 L-threonylcarbamoyladenylate synthase [Kiritimatiellia bacterium]HRU18738.1 L-threonylcarbamoyladenylate synthase [Kiritimatiellia bacterium]
MMHPPPSSGNLLPPVLRATPDCLSEAARLLCAGGIAVIPTDTVYGIAAHPDRPEAVARLSAIKRRAEDKPIALLAADVGAVRAFGAHFPEGARRLADACWPGALTLVLACGERWEGFRVPDHAFTRALLAACGGTLRVTSANLSGAMPATSAAQALQDVGLVADRVLDDGLSPGGTPSTVVKAEADGTLTVLREGAIPATAIRRLSRA